MDTRPRVVILPLLIVALLALTSAWVSGSWAFSQGEAKVDRDAVSLRAFATVSRVLRHPRCLNCHPSGDVPRIGDERQLHRMNVQRGPEDHGAPGLNCSTCHQQRNQNLIGVPGAPHWALAPRSMAWEGLDDHSLAEQLKDRTRNGDRSFEDLIRHMGEDPLVGWGWAPDKGRSPVPISREEFVTAFRAWIENGAVSPPPGKTTY